MNEHKEAEGDCQHLDLDASSCSELGVFVEPDGVVVISGSRQRLLDFAEALKRFADSAEPGAHIHADPDRASDSESAPLIIECATPAEPEFDN